MGLCACDPFRNAVAHFKYGILFVDPGHLMHGWLHCLSGSSLLGVMFDHAPVFGIGMGEIHQSHHGLLGDAIEAPRFFSETGAGKHVPRCVMVDLEPTDARFCILTPFAWI